MNKKFFGLLLGCAALFSVSTLQSCKDTSEDLLDQIESNYSDITVLKGDVTTLQGKVATLEGKVSDLEGKVADLQGRMTQAEKDIKANAQAIQDAIAKAEEELAAAKAELQDAIDALEEAMKKADEALQDSIDQVAENLDALNTKVDELAEEIDEKLEEVNAKIDAIEAALATLMNAPTGVTVHQVSSSVYGSYNNVLGMHSNLLITYYGESNRDFHEFIEAGDALVTGTSGVIYATIDPISNDFSNDSTVTVALVNSKGENTGVELSLAKSDELLTMGLTRAESDNHLYALTAKVDDIEKVQHVTVKKEVFRPIFDNIMNHKGSSFTEIANLLHNALSFNLVANAVEVTTSVELPDTTVSTSVISRYEIANVAAKPLSFKQIDALETSEEAFVRRALNGLADVAVKSLKVAAKAAGYVADIDLPKINITYNGDGKVFAEYVVAKPAALGGGSETIKVEITQDQVQALLDKGTDLNWIVAQVKRVLDKANDKLASADVDGNIAKAVEKFYNRLESSRLGEYKDKIYDMVEPEIIIDNNGTIERLSTIESMPTVVTSATVKALATSLSYELFVPYAAKFVAGPKVSVLDGQECEICGGGQVFDGSTKSISLTFKPGINEIFFDVCDFTGARKSVTLWVNYVAE